MCRRVSCSSWIFLFCVFVFVELASSVKGKCPSLDTPYFGSLSGNCTQAIAGDICTVSCHSGYEVEGQEDRICNSSGRWTPMRRFSCIDRKTRCHGLPIPVRGYLKTHCSNIAGSECIVGCLPGYELIGSERIICVRSLRKWIPFKKPVCKRTYCTELEDPPNGYKIPGRCRLEFGETCEFYCNAGFYLVGSARKKCTANGLWSGRHVRCLPMCPRIMDVTNGKPWSQCDPGIAGYSCHVTCIKGYQLDRQKDYITCGLDGNWNDSLPKCKKSSCPPLDSPENGVSLGSCRPGIFGQPCIFLCNYGYELNGNSSSICTADNKWSNPVPLCTKIVCPPVPMTNVEIPTGICTQAEPDNWCHVKCMPGFRITGTQNVTCSISGEWTGKLPDCKKRNSCHRPKPPKHGFLGECDFNIGGRCHQLCDADYVAEGPDYRKCMESGQWDGSKRRCIRKNKFQEQKITE